MESTLRKVGSQARQKELQATNIRNFRTFLLVAQLDRENISARIVQARKEAGLTQADVADLLKVHKSTVENYEHGKVNYREMNRVAAVLGKPVEWLLHGDQEPATDGIRAEIAELRAMTEEILSRLPPAADRAVGEEP